MKFEIYYKTDNPASTVKKMIVEDINASQARMTFTAMQSTSKILQVIPKG